MIRNKLRFVETDGEEQSLPKKKKKLRRYMKERRSQNDNKDVKERLLIENFETAIFSKTTWAGTSRNFFVYLSFSSEAPTDGLIEILKAKGHAVYCPCVEEKEMTAVLYGEDFAISRFGVREPVGEKYEGEIDVIVMPLLAVDERGNRLGYGGGFYDRFLQKHSNATRVAYCYDFQIIKEIPTESWDEKVDLIVTDKRIVRISRK